MYGMDTIGRVGLRFGAVLLLMLAWALPAQATYYDEVMADSPIGYWQFEETSGTLVSDSSSYGRDGTFGGTAGLLGAAGVPGIGGSAGTFDGTSGFVDLPGTWGGTAQMTVEAWVNTADPITGTFQAVVSATDTTGFGHLQMNTTGNPGFYTDGAGSFVGLSTLSPTPTNQWRHIVFVAKSGDSRLYVDGQQVGGSNTLAFSQVLAHSDVHIGNGHVNGRFFNGLIDEVAIYDTALSAEDVLAHYRAVVPEPNLVAHWTFDNDADGYGGGSDSAGGYNGTLTGGATITPESAIGAGALDLRDVSGSVSVSDNIFTGQESMTLAYWVSADSVSGLAGVVTNNAWAAGALHANIYSGAQAQFALNGGPSAYTSALPVGDGSWTHVAFAYDATAGVVTPYVNGVALTPVTGGTQPMLLGPLSIGSWNADRYLDGRLDDVRIYDGVLLQGEIAELAVLPYHTPDLAAHWTFDVDGTDVAGGNNAILGGSASITNQAVVGDGALDLRGVSGYGDVTGSILSGASAVTVAYWVSLDALDQSWGSAILAGDNWATSLLHTNIPSATGLPEFAIGGNSPGAVNTGIPLSADGSWNHIAFTYDAATKTLIPYVNGVAQTPVTLSTAYAVTLANVTIGAWDTTGGGTYDRFLNGRIDDLRIYNGVLSPEDIAALAVPEPSSLILSAMALLGLSLIVRRRWK